MNLNYITKAIVGQEKKRNGKFGIETNVNGKLLISFR